MQSERSQAHGHTCMVPAVNNSEEANPETQAARWLPVQGEEEQKLPEKVVRDPPGGTEVFPTGLPGCWPAL